MTDFKSHFTAVIEVIEVIPEHQPVNRNGYGEGKRLPKQTSEVARIVLRADSIADLKQQIQSHVGLLK